MKKYHATILIVEDDPNDRFLIERAFRAIGVRDPIQLVNDGAEAIAYLIGDGKYADREKFAYPTFVVTDLKMPRADGFAVLEFLKGNPEWAIIPTIVLTGSRDLDDIKKSYLLGANSYHVKPPTQEKLEKQLAVIHAYWMTCEVPEVDITGKQMPTDSRGKLGERFAQPCDQPESNGSPTRVKPKQAAARLKPGKEKNMKTLAGLWIDHREAVIVLLSNKGQETRRIESHVEKQLRRSGRSPSSAPFEAQMVPADDSRQREYTGNLAHYYDEVISCLRPAEEILLFGPGEAKGELKKRIERDKLDLRVHSVETTDKMTEPQILQKVRSHYFPLPKRRQAAVFPH